MNIFHKATLQGLRKNRSRTLVTLIGITLSSALITAIATFAVSLQSYMTEGAAVKYGNWYVGYTDVSQAFIEKQAKDARVTGITAYKNIGYTALEESQNPNKPYAFLASFSEDTFQSLPVNLLSGRLPENASEVLLPAHLASNGGIELSVGDTITLSAGIRQSGDQILNQHDPYRAGRETLIQTGERSYTIVGIFQRPAFEEYTAPGYTLITISDNVLANGALADTVSDGTVKNLSAFVTLDAPRHLHPYLKDQAGSLPYILNDDVLRFTGFSGDQTFNLLLYTTGTILIVLVMVGSVFLIYNAFHISLNERTHQLGILMSVGATAKQIRGSVLFEGLCIGTIGIPLGMLIGIPSIGLVLALVRKNFANVLYDNVPLTLRISAPPLLIAAGIGMTTILLSAYLPARKAARTSVMECIRQTNEIKVPPNAVRTSALTARICGLEGSLASKNFKRNKKRYRSIILSLTLSVILFVSANTFRADFTQFADQSEVQIDGDVLFYTWDMTEKEAQSLYSEMKENDNITRSTFQANQTYTCTTEDLPADFKKFPLKIQYIDEEIYRDYLKDLHLPEEEYTGEPARVIIVGVDSDAHKTLFTGQTIQLTLHGDFPDSDTTQTKSLSAAFADSYPLDPLPEETQETDEQKASASKDSRYSFMAIAPYSMKTQLQSLGGSIGYGMFFWSENPAQSSRQMQAVLDGSGTTKSYTLYNVHALLDSNRNLLFIVDLFTAIFLIMITLIAVANVLNTISTNIQLRRRELAMLRSVGMSDRSFYRMLCYECVLYGLKTMFIGLPLSVLTSWLINKGMTAGGAAVSYHVPWVSIGISILGVFLVIFLTMLYAVGKVRRENIIDALRDDIL